MDVALLSTAHMRFIFPVSRALRRDFCSTKNTSSTILEVCDSISHASMLIALSIIYGEDMRMIKTSRRLTTLEVLFSGKKR